MVNLVNDLQILTSIPDTALTKLERASELLVGHAVFESIQRGEGITEIDLGYGILTICTTADNIKYRFTPSSSLEKSLVKTVETNVSPIKKAADDKLKIKLRDTYKELI